MQVYRMRLDINFIPEDTKGYSQDDFRRHRADILKVLPDELHELNRRLRQRAGVTIEWGFEKDKAPMKLATMKRGQKAHAFVNHYGTTLCGISGENPNLIIFDATFDPDNGSVDCKRCQSVIDKRA